MIVLVITIAIITLLWTLPCSTPSVNCMTWGHAVIMSEVICNLQGYPWTKIAVRQMTHLTKSSETFSPQGETKLSHLLKIVRH